MSAQLPVSDETTGAADQPGGGGRQIALDEWIAGWQESLRQGDGARFLALFTEDASFQMSPFEVPLSGFDIRNVMDEYRKRQGGGDCNVQVWAQAGDTAILGWSTSEADSAACRMLGDGVLILRLGTDGRCKQARQWHHWHSAGAPLSSGFVENPPP
jgi:hypothetical protein